MSGHRPATAGDYHRARQRGQEGRYGGTGYASFEAEAHRPSRRAKCAGCGLALAAFASLTEFTDHRAICEGDH